MTNTRGTWLLLLLSAAACSSSTAPEEVVLDHEAAVKDTFGNDINRSVFADAAEPSAIDTADALEWQDDSTLERIDTTPSDTKRSEIQDTTAVDIPEDTCELGSQCDDDDLCTDNDSCKLDEYGGLYCSGSPVVIDDGNPCTEDVCDDGNTIHIPINSGSCELDDLCSATGTCDAGVCLPDTPCECYDDTDCLQPDSPCDGTAYCDTNGTFPKCKVDPASVVVCDAPSTPCQQAICNADTGLCEQLAVTDGVDCNDDNACTKSDACSKGACTGTPVICNDGAFCNGVENCDTTDGCIAGNPPPMDDNIACTIDACDEENDVVTHTPNNDICDDDTFCNGTETCHSKDGCIAGNPPSIDDSIACTIDACDEENDVVTHMPNNELCSVTGICKVGLCQLGLGCITTVKENCCGNGLTDGSEDCDDGGISLSCDSDCTWTECGDGTVNAFAGEVCDDGGNSAFCDSDCTAPYCGDGLANTKAGEECDGEPDCDEDCTVIPSLSVVTVEPIAYEGGAKAASIRINLASPLTREITVGFTLSGSAELGSDYSLNGDGLTTDNTVTIAAGQSGVDISISPILTPTMERTETMTLTLTPAEGILVAPDTASTSISVVEFGPSPGVVYHVAPAGSDTNDGSYGAPFQTLDHAVSMLSAGDTLFVHDGTYTNPGFTEDHGKDGKKDNNNPAIVQVGLTGSADTWTRIAAYPDGNNVRPKLRFDGEGGIQIKPGASHIRIEGLEIEGPNRTIRHEWAYEHRWTKEALYNGRGIFTWGPADHIVIRNCDVHHTPNSGIRFNKADYILVEGNQVSNATWWSSSAESGIVIATALHIDTLDVVKILYSGNVVYNNWNFMEFCSESFEGSTEPAYGNCDYYQGGIIDGQGLYVTRNYDTYKYGRMRFENNIAFNNGFGGVTYHKTDHGELVNNLVFMNGAYPGTSKYTGLTLNTADDVLIQNNIVWARDLGDYAIKNNGNATNVTAINNYVVGESQFGSKDENTIIAVTDAPPFNDFFTKVTGIASIVPHPDATSGPASAAEIDSVLSSLQMDFRPLPTSWQIIDAGVSTEAPPVDIVGTPRTSDDSMDIGPFSVIGKLTCKDNGLTPGATCNDGLLSTADDTCAPSGACIGTPFGCYAYPCYTSSIPNGSSCDVVFQQPGVPCNDGADTTLVDVCDGTGQCIGSSPAEVILHADFETQSLGAYEQSMVQDDFGAEISWNNGLDEGRALIEQDPGNRFLRISYPIDGVGPGDGGAQFKVPLNISAEELYISYRVRFKDGFDFVKGGKLPGLCGGDCNTGGNVPDGTDGFSARLMWRTDGKVVQYMYTPDQLSQWGDNLYWDADGQRAFAPGQWHHIRTRIVMNTPGFSDGILQSWFDGVMALDRDDIRYRDIKELTLDALYFSTFFGGSGDDWAPTDNEYADFDDFIITTEWPSTPK